MGGAQERGSTAARAGRSGAARQEVRGRERRSPPTGRVAVAVAALAAAGATAPASGQTLFEDDFESGLDGWVFPLADGHELVEDPDPARGRVLELRTRTGPVVALVRGSEEWDDVRIEGDMLFVEDVHNYLGFVYRYVDDGRRVDFGNVYVKGNGSYIRVNPHRDVNVGRTLHEELRTPLEGERRVEIGEWKPFALEVVGGAAHLYVGDMSTPALTFDGWEGTRGAFGFKPRNPGGAVRIDRIRAVALDGFSWRGGPIPDVAYRPESLVTGWSALGPLTAFAPAVEDRPFDPGTTVWDDGREVGWEPFSTDARGAVLTGKLTEHRGGRRVAYFHAVLSSPRDGVGSLRISSVDDVALWLDGTFLGFASGDPLAWFDVGVDPERKSANRLPFRAGENHLVVRVVGGSYATGGFFMAFEPPGAGAEGPGGER